MRDSSILDILRFSIVRRLTPETLLHDVAIYDDLPIKLTVAYSLKNVYYGILIIKDIRQQQQQTCSKISLHFEHLKSKP